MKRQRGRRLLRVAALVGIASLGMAFSACRENRDNLLGAGTAAGLNRDIDRINELVAEGNCLEALQLTEEIRIRVENLGEDADPTLRKVLLDGVTQLAVTVQSDCEPATADGRAESGIEQAPVEELAPAGPDTGQASGGGGNQPDSQPDSQQGGSGGGSPESGGVTPGGTATPEQSVPQPPTGGNSGD